MASLVASLSVFVPNSTARTSAPSRCMRSTFRGCRRMSSAPLEKTHSRRHLAQHGAAGLAGPGPGRDAVLAEAPREHGLAERIVQLVRARVEEVLALEVEPLARR